MDNNTLFYEKQQLYLPWLWLILALVNGLFIYAIVQQTLTGIPFGDKPMPTIGLIIIEVIFLAITIMLITAKLHTKITATGILVKFSPFHYGYKYFQWKQISKCYVRNFSPIGDFGGWGIRYGIMGKGKGYIVSGNVGLQLEMNGKKTLLISTKQPEQINALITQLGQLKT